MPPPRPDLVERLSQGYRETAVLVAAVQLRLFDHLVEQTKDATALAGALGTAPRATRILADACVALGLLTKTARGRYGLTPVAREQLVSTMPGARNDMITLVAALYHGWGHLATAVRTDAPVPASAVPASVQPNEAAFARAMAVIGRQQAAATAKHLQLGRVRRVLDVGAGPGFYAIAFAQAQPRLTVTVFDRPKTVAIALANARAAGVGDRVQGLAGDVLRDPVGEGYDLIFASNLIHSMAATEVAALVRKLGAALAPGGQLVIKDFIPDDTRRGPAWPLLFAVNMLVNCPGGDCYTQRELKGWFAAAGLQFRGHLPVAANSTLVYAGRRPAR